jgi:hypothetical protein
VGEVVFVQRLVVRHLGDPQGVPQTAFPADGQFFLQQQIQEVQMAHAARDQLILASGVIAGTDIDLVGTIGRPVLAHFLPGPAGPPHRPHRQTRIDMIPASP